MSDESIRKGAKWQSVIGAHLEECRFGILCVTPDNLDSKWIHFEAGALSKVDSQDHVSALLLGVNPAELEGPLTQFQNTTPSKDDMLKLVQSINSQLSDPVPEAALTKTFDGLWSNIAGAITTALEAPKQKVESETRSDRSVLEEILAVVRTLSRTSSEDADPSETYFDPTTGTRFSRGTILRAIRRAFGDKIDTIRPLGSKTYEVTLKERPPRKDREMLAYLQDRYDIVLQFVVLQPDEVETSSDLGET